METHWVSRFGLTVQRCQADKQTDIDAGSSPLRFSFPLGRKSCGYCPVTLPLTVNSTCNMATTVASPNANRCGVDSATLGTDPPSPLLRYCGVGPCQPQHLT